jgi:hypothetical protein
VQGSYKHGNEYSGSIICWKVLEFLHNWRLLRKDSAPRVSESETADEKTKGSGLNGSKHYPNSISS